MITQHGSANQSALCEIFIRIDLFAYKKLFLSNFNFGGNPVALKEMRARMHLFCTRRRLWPGAAAGVNFYL